MSLKRAFKQIWGTSQVTLQKTIQMKYIAATAVMVVGLCGVVNQAGAGPTPSRPNIVILLVDDAGFMDFSSYGGEAQTRHIDRLGQKGVRFSNYHTSPLCAPSRAMLLTGMDSHRTGIGTIPEVLALDQEGHHAYALKLLPGVETLADHLKGAGYRTLMTGKWHLGRGAGDLPNDHGFDRSFVLDASGADNWEQKPFLPFYDHAPWFEDGKPAQLPDDFYSSRFLVDQMISYIDETPSDPNGVEKQPFFAFIGFQAIHIPIQAPAEFTNHYQDTYRAGWDAIKAKRLKKARAMGFIPPDAPDPAPPPGLRDWQSLSPDEKAHMERRMMVNAGMLEAMDFHIGRLIDHLEARGELDNTIFIVTSDNGPEYGDPLTDPRFRLWMYFNGYHDDFATMGEKGSMAAIGPEWASAAAAPGALFKMYASQGGMRVPLIITGPGITPRPIITAKSFVTDLAPTVLDLIGLDAAAAMDGRSLGPVLRGQKQEVYGAEEAIGIEVAGNAALFKGPYKLTRNALPYGDAQWRLHHVLNDPGERMDLAAEMPQKMAEMMQDYETYAARVGVIALPDDFNIFEQISINAQQKIRQRLQPYLVGFAVLGLLLAGFIYRRRRARG